jgi:hypothetical protein
MKQLQKEDLIEGEIYKAFTFNNNKYIFKKTNHLTDCDNINSYLNIFHKKTGNFNYNIASFTEITPEEKHWLEECIKIDKFVSYEDAMKTFEPEFVLPEKWCVKNTNEKISEFFNSKLKWNSKCYSHISNKNKYLHSMDSNRNNVINSTIYANVAHDCIIKNYTEITFEQFKKYVLKEEVMETPKDKVLETSHKNNKFIKKVECSEGGIYKLGDKITVFTKDSPNKGKIFTIKGFRWNNAKTNLCAITELHTPNGIGLDKIELYIEPKKELSLLEQAKLRYPVNTRYYALYPDIWI